MLKNPVFLVIVAVVVAGVVWLVASRSQPQTDLKPLTPPPGESLRRQGVPPRPQKADPAEALKALEGAAVLPPGDAVLRDLSKAAQQASEEPTYRANIDVPFNDLAARQISDEVREWIDRKMAGFGFGSTSGKPTVVWTVQIDPGESGAYLAKLRLRASSETKHEASYQLPAAYSVTRLDTSLAAGFGAPLIPPAAPTAPTAPPTPAATTTTPGSPAP